MNRSERVAEVLKGKEVIWRNFVSAESKRLRRDEKRFHGKV